MYGRPSMFLWSLLNFMKVSSSGQFDARRFLGELLALADVCVVFLEWHLFGKQIGQNRLSLSPVWVLRLNRCEMFFKYICNDLIFLVRFSTNIPSPASSLRSYQPCSIVACPPRRSRISKTHNLLSSCKGLWCLCSPLGRPRRRTLYLSLLFFKLLLSRSACVCFRHIGDPSCTIWSTPRPRSWCWLARKTSLSISRGFRCMRSHAMAWSRRCRLPVCQSRGSSIPGPLAFFRHPSGPILQSSMSSRLLLFYRTLDIRFCSCMDLFVCEMGLHAFPTASFNRKPLHISCRSGV